MDKEKFLEVPDNEFQKLCPILSNLGILVLKVLGCPFPRVKLTSKWKFSSSSLKNQCLIAEKVANEYKGKHVKDFVKDIPKKFIGDINPSDIMLEVIAVHETSAKEWLMKEINYEKLNKIDIVLNDIFDGDLQAAYSN